MHTTVVRGTFPSQNAQNTAVRVHVWKLKRRKSAHRCGVKHISKSKSSKKYMIGTLLEVMSKKSTPLWQAPFNLKMHKAHHIQPLLEVEVSKTCTPVWQEAHFETKVFKALLFWTPLGCPVVEVRCCGAKHVSKSTCTKHTRIGPLFRCRFLWQAQGIAHLVKIVKNLTVLWY